MIAITGSTVYAQTNTCTTALAANATCAISVIFTPTATGAAPAGTVTVTSSASNSPQTATLSGTGAAAPSFVVSSTTPTETVAPGGTAQFNINVASLGGSYTNPVTLSASGGPAGASFTFSPPIATPGSAGATSIMSVQTPALFARATGDLPRHGDPTGLAVLAGIPLLGLAGLRRQLRNRLRSPLARVLTLLAFALALLPSLAALSGCSGGYYGPAPQTYTITVTGTSGSTQQSTTVSLTVQ
jgi:hypothetical protein